MWNGRKTKPKKSKIILSNSNNIKEVEVITTPKINNCQTTEHAADENTRQLKKAPVRMWNLWTGPGSLGVAIRPHAPTNCCIMERNC